MTSRIHSSPPSIFKQFVFLLITLLPVRAFAQAIKSLLSYEVTETSYYKLPPDVDIHTVSMLDLVKMKFSTQRKQVEKKITTQKPYFFIVEER